MAAAVREFCQGSGGISRALPATLKADAVTRMADCQYYTGDYRTARDTYARAKAENASDADYASYRHAVMLGLDGDVNGKIKELFRD